MLSSVVLLPFFFFCIYFFILLMVSVHLRWTEMGIDCRTIYMTNTTVRHVRIVHCDLRTPQLISMSVDSPIHNIVCNFFFCLNLRVFVSASIVFGKLKKLLHVIVFILYVVTCSVLQLFLHPFSLVNRVFVILYSYY